MNPQSEQDKGLENLSMPPGIIIPVLVYPDVATAVVWLCSTFGFKERLRIGDHRSQLVFTTASVIVTTHQDASTMNRPFLTHSLMVCIDNVDQHFSHVKTCNAKILHPPETYPFGERQYSVEDLGGHQWTFTQSVKNVSPDEWGGRLFD